LSLRPFHLAIPVDDLDGARQFYGKILGLPEGRSSDHWIDFNFEGHQLVVHLVPEAARDADAGRNAVDGDQVPVPHFGIVLEPPAFQELAARLADQGWPIILGPRQRFAGQPAEQWTMFLRDAAGNALEFKAFADDAALFRRD
jgi:uncharacterized protein